VCSSWGTCNENLQANNCTFTDTAVEALLYSLPSTFNDINLIQRRYGLATQSLRHLCTNVDQSMLVVMKYHHHHHHHQFIKKQKQYNKQVLKCDI